MIVERLKKHDRFPVLDTAWPTVAQPCRSLSQGRTAAPDRFDALPSFLNSRAWDECSRSVSRQSQAVAAPITPSRLAGCQWAGSLSVSRRTAG